MKLGDTFDGLVRGLTSDGNGVVEHPSGKVVFVPGTWPGEQLSVKITAIKSQFAQGRLVALQQAHPQRRTPACPHQGSGPQHCGGCPWQFMAYPAQLEAKQTRVEQAMARLAPRANVQPIWPAPQEWAYRNRAQFKSDGKSLGYLAANSHQLVPIRQCPVLTAPAHQQFEQLLAQLPNAQWQKAAKRQWVSLDVNETASSLNQRLPFAQANAAQNQRMLDWLRAQLAPLDRQAPVLELFAGSGNFTRVIAEAGFAQITALDIASQAISELQNAQLPGVTAQAADLFAPDALAQWLKRTQARVLVLDPPRDGLKQAQALVAKKTALEQIFYISCDLATFSRDLALLLQQGFALRELQPLDQCPHTPHIELLARLTRA
jgi:23S rRNA (uracil1939-C5)-methyltransferase